MQTPFEPLVCGSRNLFQHKHGTIVTSRQYGARNFARCGYRVSRRPTRGGGFAVTACRNVYVALKSAGSHAPSCIGCMLHAQPRLSEQVTSSNYKSTLLQAICLIVTEPSLNSGLRAAKLSVGWVAWQGEAAPAPVGTAPRTRTPLARS